MLTYYVHVYFCAGPSIVGGIHWTTGEVGDSGSESEDDVGSIAPPTADDESR